MLSVVPHRGPRRPEVVDELRRLIARGLAAETRPLPFGLPVLDAHLPQGGLTSGALHEVVPETPGDTTAALGFVTAVTATMLARMSRTAPVLLVTGPRALTGRLYGHGLNGLGLDPGRVVLVDTANATQAQWPMEEALRSGVPGAVMDAVEHLDFGASQRLSLAAGDAGRPLLLLRPPGLTSVAVTRWRIGAARAAPDRFGLLARWRWQLR